MNPRLLFLLLLFPLNGFAAPKPDKDKDVKVFKAFEDSLVKIGPAVFRGTNDQKFAANKKFSELLYKAINTAGAFDYPFDSLKFIGNLTAPDKAFRIFNWNIPKDDGTYMYYGYIVVDESKVLEKKAQKNQYVIYELVDKSNEIRNPELSVLSPEKWFGALYYQIILKEDRDHKKFYTLLGWDGNNSMTWKKILDAITFGRDGKPIFGEKQIFQRNKKRTSNRVIFEFRGELTMALHWDDRENAIVFDHLAPEVSGAEGMYQFYSSDGSYDAFIWKKGKWTLSEDYKAQNPSTPQDKNYNQPTGDQNPSGQNQGTSGDRSKPKKKLFHRKPAPVQHQ